MDTSTLIASAVERSAFRRLAQLSEEDQKKVVEKVKGKLQGDDFGTESEDVDYPWMKAGDEEESGSEDAKGEEVSQSEAEEEPSEPESEEAKEEPSEDDEDSEEPSESESDKDSEGEPESEAEETDEEPSEDDKDSEGELELDDDRQGKLDELVEDLQKEVEEVREDGKVSPSEVLKLFDNMMGMVTLLVNAKLPNRTRKSSVGRLVRLAIADRVAADFMAARGQQVRRKDKDTMQDTGGVSKGRARQPEEKPPREDVTRRYRKKDTPAEDWDKDIDRDPDKD